MDPEYQKKYYDIVIKKMLGCGDPENSFVAYRCLQCGEVKKVPFSCKSSFCLSKLPLEALPLVGGENVTEDLRYYK